MFWFVTMSQSDTTRMHRVKFQYHNIIMPLCYTYAVYDKK